MRRPNRCSWLRHSGGRPSLAADSLERDAWPVLPTHFSPAPREATEKAAQPLTPPARFRSLLVPVDGGPFGEHALPAALKVARLAGAEVRVAHVYRPVQSPHRPETLYYDSSLDAQLRRRGKAYLGGLVQRLRRVTDVRITPVFLEGKEVADALGEAARAGTDLVVMATHGRGPVGRLWFGSVADALTRRLSVPLLLVPGYKAPVDLTGDPLLRRLLIPLDGSAHAEQILGPTLTLGALTGADHTLLKVVRPVPDYGLGYDADWHTLPMAREEYRARAYLRRLADKLDGGTCRVRARIVFEEQPVAQAILEYGQKHDADLIALATRGRGGLARLFRGSVADQVVRGASVPVLVYRPDGEAPRQGLATDAAE